MLISYFPTINKRKLLTQKQNSALVDAMKSVKIIREATLSEFISRYLISDGQNRSHYAVPGTSNNLKALQHIATKTEYLLLIQKAKCGYPRLSAEQESVIIFVAKNL